MNVESNLSKRAKYVSSLLDHWWTKWRDDYLTELREFHKLNSHKRTVNPKVGDVVLVVDDKMNRAQWKVGRITELIYSKDNNVRSAQPITKNKGTILRRPINKLFPIMETEQS